MLAYLGDADNRVVLEYENTNGMTYFVDQGLSTTGENSIKEIRYHPAQGNGDRHFVDVYFGNGKVMRDFDISYVVFE